MKLYFYTEFSSEVEFFYIHHGLGKESSRLVAQTGLGEEVTFLSSILELSDISGKACLYIRHTYDIASIGSDLSFWRKLAREQGVGIANIDKDIVQWLSFLEISCVEL